MKVLFVNNFRGRGGGEEFLRDLLPGLAQRGVQVGLVCRPGTPLETMFRDSSVEVLPLDRSGLKAVSAALTMAKVIRERGYQLVNIQRGHDIIHSWLAAQLSGSRPKLMYTPQVPEFLRSRFLLRRMDAIATISRHIRDGLTSFDQALAARTTIVYYGIDLDRFRPAAERSGFLRIRFSLPGDTRIVGTVGDLWKNQIEFLDALLLLRKRFGDVRYAIVGSRQENDLTRAFDARAGELGLTDAVLWPGRLAKEDMMSFYADLDLAVSTYRNEGFGIWVLEAMAMGRPVVSYNAGGIRDSLEGSPSGLLVDGGPPEMAAVMGDLLEDRQRLAAMGEAGPGWVRARYRRDRMVMDYARYFEALVGEKG